MDSKNIFISSETYARKILWQRNNSADSEWFYIGNDTSKLNMLIDAVFAVEQSLYLVTDRHNSKQLSKLEMHENVRTLLEKTKFSIWNSNFEKVIEFDKIGVYRIGEQKDLQKKG